MLAFLDDWIGSSSSDVLCLFPLQGCNTCSHPVYQLFVLFCRNNPCWSLGLPQSLVWNMHSPSNFIPISLLIKMLCSTEWRTDSYRSPTENVPGLQVYWHPFVCQFLIQLESQIDLVSLFLYKNVGQCYVKLYRILCVS